MRGLRSGYTNRSAVLGRPAVAWLVALILLLGESIHGQVVNRSSAKFYPDSSDTAEALLRNAASHARDRQWSAAIEIYQRVIDQFGDKVARFPTDDGAANADSGFVLYVDDRMRSRVSGMRLAVSFGVSALAVYVLGPVVKAAGFAVLLTLMAGISTLSALFVAMLPGERSRRRARPVVWTGSSSSWRIFARVGPSRRATAASAAGCESSQASPRAGYASSGGRPAISMSTSGARKADGVSTRPPCPGPRAARGWARTIKRSPSSRTCPIRSGGTTTGSPGTRAASGRACRRSVASPAILTARAAATSRRRRVCSTTG